MKESPNFSDGRLQSTSSFFSRLGAKQTKKSSGCPVTCEDEVKENANEDDIVSWEISSRFKHGISYGSLLPIQHPLYNVTITDLRKK